MGEQTSPKIQIREAILKYFAENRRPFGFQALINRLADEGVIEECNKGVAAEIVDKLYEEGYIVDIIYPETTEVCFIFQFEIDEEINHYLKQNGGRSSISTLVDYMYDQRGFNTVYTKAELLDNIRDKSLIYDTVTEEVFIPTTT